MGRRIDNFQKLAAKAVEATPAEEPNEEERGGHLLTEEEMREIEDGLKAEILAEAKELEKKKYKEEAKRKLRVLRGLDEPQVTVLIDIPGFADKIALDGRPYYHGYTYTVPDSVAQALMNQMDMSWRHEDNVGGANHNEYRKPRNTRLHAGTGAASNIATIQNSATNPTPLTDLSRGRMTPRVTNTSQSLAQRV